MDKSDNGDMLTLLKLYKYGVKHFKFCYPQCKILHYKITMADILITSGNPVIQLLKVVMLEHSL